MSSKNEKILNSDDFIKSINDFLESRNKKTFNYFWEFVKEVDGVGIFAQGAEAIWNIVVPNLNNATQEALDEVKAVKIVDLALILNYSNNLNSIDSETFENFIENYNRDVFIKYVGGIKQDKVEEYDDLLVSLKTKIKLYKNLLETPREGLIGNKDDISNLPEQLENRLIERTMILNDIKDSFKDKRVITMFADGGFGKSTLAYQYYEKFKQSYTSVYAYSFHGQGWKDNSWVVKDPEEVFKEILTFYTLDEIIENYSIKRLITNNIESVEKKDIQKGNTEKLLLQISKHESKESKILLVKLLVEVLKVNKKLLILDGFEVVLKKDGSIVDRFNMFNLFFQVMLEEENFFSRVLITSRNMLKIEYNKKVLDPDRIANKEIQILSSEEITEFFNNFGIETESAGIKNLIKSLSSSKYLANPLVLVYVCRYIKQKYDTNKGVIDNIIVDIFTEDISQIKSIEDAINKLFIKLNLNDIEKNFMTIASFLYKPITDNDYKKIVKKLNDNNYTLTIYPEYSDELVKKLENSFLVSFDRRDAGKIGVNEGTFDIHPIVKNYFRGQFEHDENKKHELYKAFGESFLEIYFKDFIKENIENDKNVSDEEITYLFDSLNYYVYAKEYVKVHEIIQQYVNGREPIKRSFKSEALDILNLIFDYERQIFYEEDKIVKITNSYKIYNYLLMTLGKSKKASKIFECTLNNFYNQLDDSKVVSRIFIKNSNELYQESNDGKIISMLDWLIGGLEDIKYAGFEDKLNKVKKYYEDNLKEKINNSQNVYVEFYDFLYHRRVFECEYMMNEEDIKVSINTLKELLEKEKKFLCFYPQNVNDDIFNENIETYGNHPHIIWRDRYVGFILDDIINDILMSNETSHYNNVTVTLRLIEDFLNSWKNIYGDMQEKEENKRYAYLYLAYINLCKIYFIKFLHSRNNSIYRENIGKYISKAKIFVFKTGKVDFIIDYYINKILVSSIKNENCNKEKEILKDRIENIDIEFLAKEAKILNIFFINSEQPSTRTYDELVDEIKNSYPYLLKRLEAIKAYKEFLFRSSR